MQYSYSLIALLFFAFLISILSAVKARSLRDYLLSSAAKYSGIDSLAYRLQSWFMDNDIYLMTVRVTAFLIAAVILVFAIYLIFFGGRGG